MRISRSRDTDSLIYYPLIDVNTYFYHFLSSWLHLSENKIDTEFIKFIGDVMMLIIEYIFIL